MNCNKKNDVIQRHYFGRKHLLLNITFYIQVVKIFQCHYYGIFNIYDSSSKSFSLLYFIFLYSIPFFKKCGKLFEEPLTFSFIFTIYFSTHIYIQQFHLTYIFNVQIYISSHIFIFGASYQRMLKCVCINTLKCNFQCDLKVILSSFITLQ